MNGSSPQTLIDVLDAEFGYGQRAIVRAGSLCVEAGRCLGLYGPNGVGKSTLVRGMVGLLLPLVGRVQRRPGLRIGYVPQHRAMELHWPMTGEDVASLAISAHRLFGWVGSGFGLGDTPESKRFRAALGGIRAALGLGNLPVAVRQLEDLHAYPGELAGRWLAAAHRRLDADIAMEALRQGAITSPAVGRDQ